MDADAHKTLAASSRFTDSSSRGRLKPLSLYRTFNGELSVAQLDRLWRRCKYLSQPPARSRENATAAGWLAQASTLVQAGPTRSTEE